MIVLRYDLTDRLQQYQNNAWGNSNSTLNSGLNNSSIFSPNNMQSLNLNASSALYPQQNSFSTYSQPYQLTQNTTPNSVSELKKLIKSNNFNLNASINRRRASLFLVACYFCMDKEPLDFLIAEGSEVNRTDIFGYNAIMSVILNENMEDDTKLQTIQMLINKGVDVNWLNIQGETALTLALERIELDIANLLLDNGAVLYKN